MYALPLPSALGSPEYVHVHVLSVPLLHAGCGMEPSKVLASYHCAPWSAGSPVVLYSFMSGALSMTPSPSWSNAGAKPVP